MYMYTIYVFEQNTAAAMIVILIIKFLNTFVYYFLLNCKKNNCFLEWPI